MKNAFYFILKALYVHKILGYLPWHFVHVRKTAWLSETNLIYRFMRNTVEKIQSVSRQNRFSSFQFIESTFGKKKYFFSVNKKEKPVTFLLQSISSVIK